MKYDRNTNKIRLRASKELYEYVKRQFNKRKQILWQYVGDRCILCGDKANSLHHLIPLAYTSEEFLPYINTPFNIVPACHDWHRKRNCHFRLNGASWVVINNNKDKVGKWTPEEWVWFVRYWTLSHLDQLKYMRARDIYRQETEDERYRILRKGYDEVKPDEIVRIYRECTEAFSIRQRIYAETLLRMLGDR